MRRSNAALVLCLFVAGCATTSDKSTKRSSWEYLLDLGVPVPGKYLKAYSGSREEPSVELLLTEHHAKCIVDWYETKEGKLPAPFTYATTVAPVFLKDTLSVLETGLLGLTIFAMIQREGRSNMAVYVEACKQVKQAEAEDKESSQPRESEKKCRDCQVCRGAS